MFFHNNLLPTNALNPLPFELPEVADFDFRPYLQVIHDGIPTLPAGKESVRLSLLIRIYLVAERLEDCHTKNIVIDAIITLNEVCPFALQWQHFKLAWTILRNPQPSRLQELMVDYFIVEPRAAIVQTMCDNGAQDAAMYAFLATVSFRYQRMWQAAGSPEDMWAHFKRMTPPALAEARMCHYHEHDELCGPCGQLQAVQEETRLSEGAEGIHPRGKASVLNEAGNSVSQEQAGTGGPDISFDDYLCFPEEGDKDKTITDEAEWPSLF